MLAMRYTPASRSTSPNSDLEKSNTSEYPPNSHHLTEPHSSRQRNNPTGQGELIGLCLDLKIRSLTGGKKSLDDVMRTLMERHNQPKPGYGENEIREVVSKIAGSNLDFFYDTLARSTEEMPFAECLGYAGLKVDGSSIEKPTAAQLEIKKGWLGGLEGR